MGRYTKMIGGVVLAMLIAGCVAAPDPFAAQVLQKGEQLDIRNILTAHPNKKAFIGYEAGTNS